MLQTLRGCPPEEIQATHTGRRVGERSRKGGGGGQEEAGQGGEEAGGGDEQAAGADDAGAVGARAPVRQHDHGEHVAHVAGRHERARVPARQVQVPLHRRHHRDQVGERHRLQQVAQAEDEQKAPQRVQPAPVARHVLLLYRLLIGR